MKCFVTKIRFVLLFTMLTCLLGCAGMDGTFDNIKKKITSTGGPDQPVAIANSIDQMPPDAASLVLALHERLTESNNQLSQSVSFSAAAKSILLNENNIFNGFTLSQVELYDHSVSLSSGRMKLESPFGRTASINYHVDYTSSGTTLIADDVTLDAVYLGPPEPVMFVIPAEKTPQSDMMKPTSYGDLLQFAVINAIDPLNPDLETGQVQEYVIFVFFVDRVSPSAEIEVKISDVATGLGGYKDATRYLDYDGWRVALLSGKFSLSNNSINDPGPVSDSNGLFLKAVFTPGKEAGILRLRKKVGLFSVGG
jgi:hypothetical protein